MSRGFTTAITTVLRRPKADFSTIVSKVKQVNFLNTQLQEMLPSPLKDHVLVTSLEQGVLNIAVSSAAWASQVRFMTNDILFQLKTLLRLEVQSLRPFVLPGLFQSEPVQKGREVVRLSQENAKLLQGLSESIQDEPLKQALASLAKRQK